MSLDQEPKMERAKAVEGQQRWTRAVAAAVAFAVVLAIVGVVTLVGDTGSPTSTTVDPVTATTLAPTTTKQPESTTTLPMPTQNGLTADEADFVTSLLQAWNSDVERYLELIPEDAVAETIDSAKYDIMVDQPTLIPREKFERMSRWEAAIGTETVIDLDNCSKRRGTIVCPFSQTDPLIDGTIQVISGVVELELGETALRRVGFAWSSDFGYGGIVNELEAWMDDNYPDQAAAVGMGGIYTPESAALWLQYVPRYLGQDAPLNAEEAAFVTELFDAWNNDIGAYLGLFDPTAEIGTTNRSKYGPWVSTPGSFEAIPWEDFRERSMWEAWFGTQTTVDVETCNASVDDLITCPFRTTDPFIREVLLHLQGVLKIEVDNHTITRLEFSWTSSANGDADPFQIWLNTNHPEVERLMILESAMPVFTEESANLWIEYVPLYMSDLRGG